MPSNITDVDAFTDPIVAPADGDSANAATFQAAPQGLANRTRNLKNRVDVIEAALTALQTAAATATFDGTLTHGEPDGVANAAKLTLSGAGTPTGWVVASDEVEVPSNGRYLVLIRSEVRLPDDSSDDEEAIVAIKAGSTTYGYATGRRFKADGSVGTDISGFAVILITTKASQKISFVNGSGSDLVVPNNANALFCPFFIMKLPAIAAP